MAYIKKKKNGSYLITVSCGRDSQDKKITRSTTYHPDLFTAKGHPKSEATIQKEVNAFASGFEKKVLTGRYTEGSALTFEKYADKYLKEYAEQSQAVRWNLISSNPMERVQVKKNNDAPDTEKIMFFSQEQAEAFLAALNNPLLYRYQRKKSGSDITQIQEYQAEHTIQMQLKLFFYLAMFTGCRRGELIALLWSDINFDESTVSVTKSTCRVDGEVITKNTKTKGSVRTLAVPSVVTDLARRWKTAQQKYRLSIGSKWCGDDYVFIKWDGSQMGLETPYQAFRRIIANYNANRGENDPELPLIPLHGLRHTVATLLISQGVDIRTVSGRLGHASTSTTLNIYSHVLKELDKAASDKLENILLGSAK